MSSGAQVSIIRLVLIPLIPTLAQYFPKTGFPLNLLDYFTSTTRNYQDGWVIVLNALIIYFTWFLLTYLYYKYFTFFAGRKAQKQRLDAFRKALEKIGDYGLSAQIITNIILSGKSKSNITDDTIKLIMDFVITEYKYELDELFGHTGIRVSVFMKADANDKAMGRAFISEFQDADKRKIQPFALEEGYCGLAWSTGHLVSGTYKPFPLRLKWRDERFAERSSRSRRKSILCLPVKSETSNEVVSIISIDSLRKFDFLLAKEMLDEIDESARPVKTKIVQLIDAMRAV